MASEDRRGRRLTTLAYFASVALIGLVSGSVGPTLAPLAAQVGVGLSVIGVTLTARSLGYLAGSLASGRWFDRIDGHRGLTVALFLAAIGLALIPQARSLAVLSLVMVALGAALSVLDVGANTLIFRTYRQGAAPYLNALHFSFGLGGLAAPFLVAAVATEAMPVAWPYRTLALFAIPTAAILLFASSGRLTPSPGERAQSGAKRLPWVAAAFAFVYAGAEAGLMSWLFVFIERSADAALATNVSGAFWAAFSLFRFVGILVARRADPARILGFNLGGGILFLLPLILAPDFRWALWVGSIGVGASIAAVYPGMISLFGRRQPLSGRQMGAMTVYACVGTMTFPWLIGRLLAGAGPRALPLACAVLLVTTLGLLRTLLGGRTSVTAREII